MNGLVTLLREPSGECGRQLGADEKVHSVKDSVIGLRSGVRERSPNIVQLEVGKIGENLLVRSTASQHPGSPSHGSGEAAERGAAENQEARCTRTVLPGPRAHV